MLFIFIFSAQGKLSGKPTNEKVRRSLISESNGSLSIDDVRREITKHISQLKSGTLCQPSEKVCVPGPPGRKGSRGSRGRRGVQGDKGKRGSQGIIGPPGRHGKQGIMGNQGIKGEKGEKGIRIECFLVSNPLPQFSLRRQCIGRHVKISLRKRILRGSSFHQEPQHWILFQANY